MPKQELICQKVNRKQIEIYGKGRANSNGCSLLELAKSQLFKLAITFFKHKQSDGSEWESDNLRTFIIQTIQQYTAETEKKLQKQPFPKNIQERWTNIVTTTTMVA